MKSIKFLSASALVAASVTAASAATTIHISGSTAFRKATVTAIENVLNTGFTWGAVGAPSTGSSQLIFNGTLKSNSAAVVIKASWKGSESGIFTVSQSAADSTNPFIADSAIGSLTTGGTNLSSSLLTDVAVADIALSDSFQSSSLYKTPALTDNKIGVIPFTWVGATGNDAPIANMTHQQAKAALAGNATLNLWSGLVADNSIRVLVVGRDEDSGTRVISFQESTFGASGSPTQFQPIGTAGAYSGLQAWPAAVVNGNSYPVGHSGYASGGTLAGVLADNTVNVTADVVGYLGQSDAKTLLSAATPGVALSWEGVSYASVSGGVVTFNDAAVENGQYTFWSYEHLFTRSSGVPATVAQTAADITARLTNPANPDARQSGYHLADMNVTRGGDGTPVFN